MTRTMTLGIVAIAACLSNGCAELAGLRAVPDLEIELERVEQVRLAEISVDRVAEYRELSVTDALRIADALASGTLPLEMTAVLSALNPSTSAARVDLLSFDWTLFVDRRETVSGMYQHPEPLPPGRAEEIGLDVSLDLLRFFDGDAEALFDLVRSTAGLGGAEPEFELRLRPVLETTLGTVRYPRDIVVGG